MKPERIIVTGGGGFIGSHLVDTLKSFGNEVVVVDPVSGNGTISEAFRKPVDGVIHLAGHSRAKDGIEHPGECVVGNLAGTVGVLEAARIQDPHPWVVLGSTRECGNDQFLYTPGIGTYATSKWFSEMIGRRYALDYGIRVAVMRFSDVYGSNRDNQDRVLPKLFRQALRGETMRVVSSDRRHDFTHIDDVVQAVLLRISRPFAFSRTTICTGRAVTIKELARLIKKATRSKSKIETVPDYELTLTMANRTDHARRYFAFKARISLEKGLARMAKGARCATR